jgi:hypothetical protein
MRKWLYFGIATVAASSLGGYWLCSKPAPIGPMAKRVVSSIHRGETHDGDAETSDTIEPLIVDHGGNQLIFQPIPLAQVEMMPRVLFAPGMQQPPRPDAEFAETPRMPYADEDELLELPAKPAAARPAVNALEDIEKEPDASEPAAEHPPRDYHRMQPHCPFPYYRR